MADEFRVRYRPNRKEFGAFMNSLQVLAPVMAICGDIAAEAARTDGTTIAADYHAVPGQPVVVAGNRRVTGEVRNDNPKAAAYEFGTGIESEGRTGGAERQANQGGFSPARRHLGFIAAGYHDVIGEPG